METLEGLIDELHEDTSSPSLSLLQVLGISPEAVTNFGDVPVRNLKLSNRSYNGLRRGGLHTIGLLLAATESQLYNIRNLGKTSVEEIKSQLHGYFTVSSSVIKIAPSDNADADAHGPDEPKAAEPLITDWAGLRPQVLQPESHLFWSIPAFLEAWRELPESVGDELFALQQRRALLQEVAFRPEFSLETVFEECRAVCSEREWDVLAARFGLTFPNQEQTLQEIAAAHQVSRERIRQIQMQAQKKLQDSDGLFPAMNETLAWLIKQAGGVLCMEHIEEALEEYFPSDRSSPQTLCTLLLELSPKFRRVRRQAGKPPLGAMEPTQGAIWAHKDRAAGFGIIMETAQRLWSRRETVIYSDEWLGQVMQALQEEGHNFSSDFVGACLRADGCFDPDRFEVMEVMRTLELAMVETLQRLGAPAHYSEITDKINEFGVWHRKANERSVHGRLGAHPDQFVCIDRGTYGLASWGLEEQRITRDLSVLIADAAEEFLEIRDEPVHEDEIVDYVLQQKECRELSIRQCLFYDERFHRFDRNVYGLSRWIF